MTIRTKLLLMGAVMAILVGVICAIGYHESKTALEESTSAEITATVDVEAATLNGWLLEKKQQAQSAADLLTAMDGNPMQGDHSLLSLATRRSLSSAAAPRMAHSSAGWTGISPARSIHARATGTKMQRQRIRPSLPPYTKICSTRS